jgi:histone deacetylase 1/2
LKITHSGSLTLPFPKRNFQVQDPLCVPSINQNLISVHHFTKHNNVFLEFHPSCFFVKDQRTREILLQGPCENGVYPLPHPRASTPIAMVHERTSINGWHQRLGHPSSKVVARMITSFSLPVSNNSSISHFCDSCSINKSHRLPFHKHGLTSSAPFDLIYTDVWGPSPQTSIQGHKYYVIFIDHFTKYVWFFPLRNKSDVKVIFPQFHKMIQNRFNANIKSLYSDNGGEFVALQPFLTLHGISHYTTAPHTPQQNGVSERRHRHIVEIGNTLLSHANLPSQFWSYAFAAATYLINRLPSPILHHNSPFQTLFTEAPNYLKLRSFGCLCFPWLKPYHTNKLQPKSVPCVFLGYSTTQSAYLCLHLPTQRLYVSRHVTFDENVYPLKNINKQSSYESSIPVAPTLSAPLLQIVTPATPAPSAPVSTAPQEELSLPTSNSDTTTTVSTVQVNIPPPVVSQRHHHMTTRSMNNIFVPKQLHTTITHPLPESPEPTCVSQALQNPLWRRAMSEEITALLNHATWELVPPADNQNLIGCKFVFRTKRNSDGTISRYKARLVAKGFHQRPGLDYSQTFSPVVKPATIRLILSIAVMNG